MARRILQQCDGISRYDTDARQAPHHTDKLMNVRHSMSIRSSRCPNLSRSLQSDLENSCRSDSSVVLATSDAMAHDMARCCQKQGTERIRPAAVSKISLSARQQTDRQASLNFKINSDTYNIHQFHRHDAAPWRASAHHTRRSCCHAFNGCAITCIMLVLLPVSGTSCIFVFK